MKKVLCFILFTASRLPACGPYFPSSYLSDYDRDFSENINLREELALIAMEYGLIEGIGYPTGTCSTAEAERRDFADRAAQCGVTDLQGAFDAYAVAVRDGDTNAVAPEVPLPLREFVLYLEGTQEFRNNPDVTHPQAWEELLALDYSNRYYRTVWTYYMLGNLASGHGLPEEASRQYAACRRAATETGKDQSLGLAHASYKREQLAQTNLTARLERGIAAVGYYSRHSDPGRARFCMDHLKTDMARASHEGLVPSNTAILEAMAVFNTGSDSFMARLENLPDLKVTPRLAWFMYKRGAIEKCRSYLARCPEDDVLANWLRFRLAQREGRTDEAIAHLRKWMRSLETSDRIVFEFCHRARISSRSALNGTMGTLYATQGELMDALHSFVQAGAYQDAALIAERYVATDELKRYVDAFPPTAPLLNPDISRIPMNTEVHDEAVRLRLACLLARRLFREGRAEEARPYYPPDIEPILTAYLDARKAAARPAGPNTRAAHLYHAARILRWKGMELCGTELYPDYTIVNGRFTSVGLGPEDQLIDSGTAPAYDETAPVPNTRFHYRQVAADLAGEAAEMAWDRNAKAMMLWSGGMWIKNRSPAEADIFYKKLARIRRQPLAREADLDRWFPVATPRMDAVHRSIEYLPPRAVARAARYDQH